MTENKRTVACYLDGFRRTDREHILSCLAEDVEWLIPAAFHARQVRLTSYLMETPAAAST